MKTLRWIIAASMGMLLLTFWLSANLANRNDPAGSLEGSNLEPVPMDETVERTIYDDDGSARVWTIRKHEVNREDLDDLVMPAASPRVEPPGPQTDSARALDAQALESWKTGNIEQALSYFEAAVEADPDDALPHANYGRLLTLMSSYAEALPHLERAAELEPDNPKVWIDLLSYYERNVLLERALYARQRAEQAAGGREIVRDQTGLWRFEGESIYP